MMKKDLITIRPAASGDMPAVWRLLHCEGRSLSDEVIAGRPGDFFLMFQGAKLLGIYHDGVTTVHPLYSQGLVEEIMDRAVNGLFDDIFA